MAAWSADYFYGGQYLGRVTLPLAATPPHQLAYFCRRCGEIWGRVLCSVGDSWDISTVPCRQHLPSAVSDWGTIPGSFVQRRFQRIHTSTMFWSACLDVIPAQVLRHEFECSLAFIEQQEQSQYEFC